MENLNFKDTLAARGAYERKFKEPVKKLFLRLAKTLEMVAPLDVTTATPEAVKEHTDLLEKLANEQMDICEADLVQRLYWLFTYSKENANRELDDIALPPSMTTDILIASATVLLEGMKVEAKAKEE